MFKTIESTYCTCNINRKYVLFTRYDFIKNLYVDFVNTHTNLRYFVPASYCNSRTFKKRCIKMKYIPYKSFIKNYRDVYEVFQAEVLCELYKVKAKWNMYYSNTRNYEMGNELILFAEYVNENVQKYRDISKCNIFFDLHCENVRMNRKQRMFFTDPLASRV